MNRNTRLGLNLGALVVGMVMLAYASVPLYQLFCAVTGYGGTVQRAVALPDKVSERRITIEFNADTDPGLPWQFAPGERKRVVKVGEQGLTHYVAKNLTDKPVTGHAVYNVVPFKAGQYFTKIHCFCFENQTLGPNQQVDMPVSFFVDPAILDDPEMNNVHTITLSYTFFPLKQ